ncbi:MAG: hypothetical protein ACRCVT_04325 [Leadbetterella sp.]
MKNFTKISVLFCVLLLSNFKSFSQEEGRFDMSMTIEHNGVKTKMKIFSLSYNLATTLPVPSVDGSTEPPVAIKPEPMYISVSSFEMLPKSFYKIFENNKNLVNGVIELKDKYGKDQDRKLEFKNASIGIAESLSSYANGNSVNFNFNTSSVTVNDVQVNSK